MNMVTGGKIHLHHGSRQTLETSMKGVCVRILSKSTCQDLTIIQAGENLKAVDGNMLTLKVLDLEIRDVPDRLGKTDTLQNPMTLGAKTDIPSPENMGTVTTYPIAKVSDQETGTLITETATEMTAQGTEIESRTKMTMAVLMIETIV